MEFPRSCLFVREESPLEMGQNVCLGCYLRLIVWSLVITSLPVKFTLPASTVSVNELFNVVGVVSFIFPSKKNNDYVNRGVAF